VTLRLWHPSVSDTNWTPIRGDAHLNTEASPRPPQSNSITGRFRHVWTPARIDLPRRPGAEPRNLDAKKSAACQPVGTCLSLQRFLFGDEARAMISTVRQPTTGKGILQATHGRSGSASSSLKPNRTMGLRQRRDDSDRAHRDTSERWRKLNDNIHPLTITLSRGWPFRRSVSCHSEARIARVIAPSK
jgi:hypothetical protein